ncbi:glycoside hydrolase [Pseudomaricurvus alkylphenolicus]|uniref:glycosyl hydrolase n=1 Tax=Pseudomaricurvus alkylphenolicus TaxID=1306991 RepID=UPI001420A5B1|nr:glycosyl hydrolase [Pseudomaricurvus alkylphenolicus]NIB43419.1 glycoside hydrolase [Pseudomaricurvus alkylphenolicus]
MLRKRLNRSFYQRIRWVLLAIICLVFCGCLSQTKSPESRLYEGFSEPPNGTRPLVWWHWMNGNVTREGIEADLLWMHQVGIGGVQNFDASLNTPLIVDERVSYMTPAWQELFNFALDEAGKYNFEFGIAASPGWSETGGPWVEPRDGMKKLVWREVTVSAESQMPIVLPDVPNTTGPFQDMPVQPEPFSPPLASNKKHPHYYEDVAILAYPTAMPAEIEVTAVVDSNGEKIEAETLFDGSYADNLTLPVTGAQPYWLEFKFERIEAVRSVSVSMPPVSMFLPSQLHPTLEASEDGKNFHAVASFELGTSPQYTLSFPQVQAKAFRLVFEAVQGGGFELPSSAAPGAVDPMAGLAAMMASQGTKLEVTEVSFSRAPRVHRGEEKAGFAIHEDYFSINSQSKERGVEKHQVLNLTSHFSETGRLNWRPQQGTWRIIRLGYSLTGKENHPATPEATGLEVDKYDADAVRRYINTYLDNYLDAVGDDKLGAEGIQAVLNDSIEVGASNWTPSMATEFQHRRGYELTPWLPVLTGVIVESSEASDAFLYDYRKTLSELLTENHYATITKELHKRGLKHYAEALENGRPTLGDGIAMRKSADIPMAAMWSFDTENNIGPKPQYWSDIREAASVAHIYGQNLVAAESLTSAMSPWAFSPRELQPMIDMEFALGVNRPIIHTSVHQPLSEKAPGLSLFVFGQYFNRLNTWASVAKPWVDYIARNSYMLRQGRHVADVAYFYGEEAPLTALFNDEPPKDVPLQNGFDYVNADVIVNEMTYDGQHLITTGGARYKTLYLGGSSRYMTLPVLEKLANMVRSGAWIIGNKPVASPSLSDDPRAFDQLAEALWSGSIGKGRVVATADLQAGLDALGIAPDYTFTNPNSDTTLMFVHRTLPQGEIYFYTNRKNRHETIEFSFRVAGKRPMHWNAETGKVMPLSYRTVGDRTIIPRRLLPYESGYIVFINDTNVNELNIDDVAPITLATLSNKWSVSFQSNRGAPEGVRKMALGNWAESDQGGIKYFSGTATYRTKIHVESDWVHQHDSISLNLGSVGDIARVRVNGQSAGVAWKPPYKIDIAPHLRVGENDIVVEVTNLWVNRLIGDKQPGVEKAYTYTTIDTYHPDAPLRPSGLMGPVTLEASTPSS